MALVKYNNNSISDVTSAASATGGAMTHIKTLTASSSSTLSFVDGSSDVVLDNTYPIYLFKFINMHPASDSQAFQFQGSTDGGSNYNTSMTTTLFRAYHYQDGTSGQALEYRDLDQANGTSFQRITDNIGGGSDECCAGTMHLFEPSSTTFLKHFLFNMQEHNATGDGVSLNMFTGGYFNTTSAIDAIQFKFVSGAIESGTIKLYGIKDS
jgi:hypothetical protein|tara:strand:- start:144 stop:773 length:630 start_codon:yes stop_codon:yes gene_type:complete